jgi:hypothetical protein
MKFKTDGITMNYKLKADRDGITFDRFNPDDYDVLGNEDFLNALNDRQPGETLYGIVNHSIFSIIVKQYGVLL